MEKVLTSMDTSHMYMRRLASTYATAHIVCYGHFATLLMAMESHAYSIMFPSNGNVLPGKLRNRLRLSIGLVNNSCLTKV